MEKYKLAKNVRIFAGKLMSASMLTERFSFRFNFDQEETFILYLSKIDPSELYKIQKLCKEDFFDMKITSGGTTFELLFTPILIP